MIFSEAGASLASLMFLWTIASQFINLIPIERILSKVKARLFPEIQIKIPEKNLGFFRRPNKIYKAVETCLSFSSSQRATKLRATMGRAGKNLSLAMNFSEEVVDVFQGVPRKWCFYSKNCEAPHETSGSKEKKYYTLTFHGLHRSLVSLIPTCSILRD